MKQVIFIFCIVLCFTCSSCGNEDRDFFATLYGTISDSETGDLIEGASITLSPGGEAKESGTDGRFEFKNLDAKQYDIQVQKGGYQTDRKSITIEEGQKREVNFQLKKNK